MSSVLRVAILFYQGQPMPSLSPKAQSTESKKQFVEPKTYWFEVVLIWIAGVSAAMQFAKFSISYDAVLIHYQEGPTATGWHFLLLVWLG